MPKFRQCKVKEQVREKLSRYQREVALVLADRLYGRKAQVPAEVLEVFPDCRTGRERRSSYLDTLLRPPGLGELQANLLQDVGLSLADVLESCFLCKSP